MADDKPVIEISKISTRFGEHVVHDGLDLEVRRAEIFALIGGSGSGKSTLLREMILLQRPDAGAIRVLGVDLQAIDEAGALALRQRWGVMFQHGGLFGSLTVKENVGLPLREHTGLGDGLIDEIADWKLAMTGLAPEVGAQYPTELSGGMLKRASLARSLSLDPELLFLDEPTAGLDPECRRSRSTGTQAARPVRPDHRDDYPRPRLAVAGRRPRRRARRWQGRGRRFHARTVAHGQPGDPEILRWPARASRAGTTESRGAGHGNYREIIIETKVNYALVGAFVLLLGAVLVAGALWLASGGAFQKKYDLYLAVEEESVAGLNLNAPVKFNGVDVGKVREIEIDPKNPERVNLLFAIERGTPIKEDTVAILKTQGLTGIAYVELSGGTRDAALLAAAPGSDYPVIRTKPSLAARLENVLTSALAKLDSTSKNINAILSEENQASFKNALADIATVAHTIAARKEAIDAGIGSAARTFENTARATAQLAPVIDRVGRGAEAVEKMGNEVARTAASAGKTASAVGNDVKRFTAETLPELERLLGELSVLSASLRRLTEQTERNPASLLFGRRPVPEGPGESGASP
jgi:phospholipid/cholesterol/gamma-HCH transport system substrate-binding protein